MEDIDDDDTSSKRVKLSGSDEEKVTKGTWRKEEDERLLEAVEKFGTENWKDVALIVTGRTAKQCRDRYKLKLDPSINHGPWTKQEDEKLMELAREHGRAWTKIARFMPGRTENAVKSRISSLERSRIRDWTPEEDALLRDLRGKNMEFENMVEEHFPNRSVHSIKKRWEILHMDEIAAKLRQNIGGGIQVPAPAQHSLTSNNTPILPSMHNNAIPPLDFFAKDINSNLSPLGMYSPLTSLHSQLRTNPTQLHPLPPQLPNQNRSRLNRQSTSMTVLLQVLGDNAGSLSNMSGNMNLHNYSSTNTALPPDIADSSETPKDVLLKQLGYTGNPDGSG